MARRTVRLPERPMVPGDDEDTQQFLLDEPGDVTSAAPHRDRCTLSVLAGPVPGAVFALGDSTEMVLGRGSEANVRIDDRGLSRKHARIYKEEDRFYVEDLGSTNGTFVGGVKVTEAQRLKDGDRIQMGRNTLLRFHLHDAFEQEAAKRLYESAVRDPLTRLYNRRYLQERLGSEYAYSERHTTPLSLLLVDIDHFKQINDSLGHPAGDAVLRVVAKTLERMLRAEDVVARYGGEEFLIVARGIDARNAMIVAERIRNAIRGLILPWDDHNIQITVSIGVATYGDGSPFKELDVLLKAADDALYVAKNDGRNCCREAAVSG